MVLIVIYTLMIFRFAIDGPTWVLSNVSCSFVWKTSAMGNWQWLSILKDKDCLYAHLPKKRTPFRSTAFSGQKSNSKSLCLSFYQTPQLPWDCLTQHPYLLLKFGQSLKSWNKSKILLHPNILFLQIHFPVSKLYNLWSWNISRLGCHGDTKVGLF